MARLYADEGFPLPVVEELRRLSHDVLTVQEAGQAGQKIPDSDVLAFAIVKRRAVLTRNRRHFIKLHRRSRAHAGIIVCTEEADFLAQAARIHQAILNCTTLNDELIRIVRPAAP